MESNKLFLMINRINAVLILMLLISALVGLYFLYNEMIYSKRRNTVEVSSLDKENEIIELSNVAKISGHTQKYVEVYTRKDGELKSGGYSRTLRNLIFINAESTNPQWLFPNNNAVLIQVSQLKDYRPSEHITTFFYIEYVTHDTNKDGKLSELDNIKLAFSSPSGKNLIMLDENITKILNHDYQAETNLLTTLVQINDEVRYRTYDLIKAKRLSDAFVVKLNQ